MLPNLCHVSSQRNDHTILTHYDETKKMVHDSQIVRAYDNLKLSYGASSQRTNTVLSFIFYLCFISFLYLDLYVLGDDALISYGSFMQTKNLCVLIHI